MEKPKIILKDGMQVLITEHLQLGDVLSQVLDITGPAELIISTFSSGEEFLRKLIALRKTKMVLKATLYTDFKAAEKTARTNTMVQHAFDVLHLCPNHSKVMVVRGERSTITLFTSQNQTRGNRLESYVLIEGDNAADYASSKLQSLKTYPLWTEHRLEN